MVKPHFQEFCLFVFVLAGAAAHCTDVGAIPTLPSLLFELYFFLDVSNIFAQWSSVSGLWEPMDQS